MKSMRWTRNQWISILVLIGFLGIHFIFSQTLSFEDSEVWGITNSQRLFAFDAGWVSAWMKPGFSLALGSLRFLCEDNWSVLASARLVSLGFAILSTLSLFKLMPAPCRGSAAALALLSPTVLLNLTRVRSDSFSLAVTLATMALLSRPTTKRWISNLIYSLGAGLALLMTPKSIDLFLILAASYFFAPTLSRDDRKRRSAFLLAPIALLVLPLLVFSSETLARLAEYGSELTKATSLTSSLDWVFVRDFVSSSPIVVLYILGGWTVGTWKFRSLDPQKRALLIVSLFSLTDFALSPQKFPFYLASRIPLWVVTATAILHGPFNIELGTSRSRIGFQRLFSTASLATLAISIYGFISTPVNHFTRSAQAEAYAHLENYAHQSAPERNYWDAIGLFPLDNQYFHYPSPNDPTNVDILETIEELKPQLILRTSKMSLLGPTFDHFLKTEYAEAALNIWVKRVPLSTDRCRWSSTELLDLAKKNNLGDRLAVISKDAIETSTSERRWIRQPIQFSNGALTDSLDETVPWDIVNPDCKTELSLTASRPWETNPGADPLNLFGFYGRL